MKIKKILVLIFNLMLVCSFMISAQIVAMADVLQGAFAVKFALTAGNDKQVVMVDSGDVITVSFKIQRTDSDEAYTTNGFQNYIHYDRSFFEFVDGSIVCNDTNGATAKKQNSITYGEIIQCQNMSASYEKTFVFCTFQLKVIGTSGSGMVYNDEVYVFDKNYKAVNVEKQHLQVMIDVDCMHTDKTYVEAKAGTCAEFGWKAYYDCDDCDAFFDESGENLIAGIPYIETLHNFSDDIVCNELGHWYECIECGTKSEYSSHNGGVATCHKKAICIVCEQEYGSLDKHNHTGEMIVENEKKASFWRNGYTGDICCADCGEVIEVGTKIPWTGRIWLFIILAIILLLIVLVLSA